jgi:hypothetical protein
VSASLIDGLPRSSHVEHYANIVKQHSRARRLVAYAKQAIETFTYDPNTISNGAGSRFLEAVRREVEAAQTGPCVDRFTTAAASCSNRAEVHMLPALPREKHDRLDRREDQDGEDVVLAGVGAMPSNGRDDSAGTALPSDAACSTPPSSPRPRWDSRRMVRRREGREGRAGVVVDRVS